MILASTSSVEVAGIVFMTISSLCCGSIGVLLQKFLSAMSLAVSVAAQKKGGLSDHPICSASGITNCISSSSLSRGKTYAKFHASSGFTTIRQYPSFKSIFVKRNGVLSGALAMVQMNRGMTLPILYIAC